MTEHKWLKFAGFLNGCTYGYNHEHCPYKKLRSLHQYQRLEHILQIDDREAKKMMKTCTSHQVECLPAIYVKKNPLHLLHNSNPLI